MKNEKILLTKDKWSHKWGIPGGGIDNDETPLQAIKREFLEETGLEISSNIKQVLQDITYFLGDGEGKPWKTLRCVYLVSPLGGILKENGNVDELLEVKYFHLAEAIKFLKMTKNNQAIAKLLETLSEVN